jgi:small subunit ribosomal protein S5e
MAANSFACEVKLFNKWSYDDISVGDISLEDYIAVKPKFAQFVPHSAGRFQQKRFKKAQCPIVERLTCSLMMFGRNNGKKVMAVRIVQHAFDIVNLLTDSNPIQQLVDAIINASPREDSTRVGSGGVVRRQAVDVSPMRRVNQAIYLITQGARAAAFRNIKSIAEVRSHIAGMTENVQCLETARSRACWSVLQDEIYRFFHVADLCRTNATVHTYNTASVLNPSRSGGCG